MLENINLNPNNKGHLNVEYARARDAIEHELHNRHEKRTAKMAVIQLLGGKVVHPRSPKLRNFVMFNDNTKAVF